MKIHDISQEVFTCEVYPGDPKPEITILSSMKKGELYNLTAFSMCAHNGTHVDAPYHFYADGRTIDEMPLDSFVGQACVISHSGSITAEDAENILKKADQYNRDCRQRILIKGDGVLTEEGAEIFARAGIKLFGTESQSVGPENAPMAVHLIMLGAQIVLLEGVRLSEVEDGAYILNAAPLNLSGSDGSPCRAILIEP